MVTTVPETMRALVLPILRRLRQEKWDVHVAVGRGQDLPMLGELGIRQHYVPMTREISPLADVLALREMYRLCCRWRFDIIHTHTLKASLIGQLAGRLAGVPVRVETVHGTRYMPDLPLWLRAALLTCERLAATQAQRVWVSNPEDLRLFVSRGLVRRGTAALLGSGGVGVDLERFSPRVLQAGRRAAYRRELGLPDDALVVGFVGRLVRDKGIHELMAAWPAVVADVPRAHLLAVAPLLTSERSSETVSPQQLAALPHAGVLTNRSDMPELYNCMDLLVLPTYREGFPCAIIESAACGVPSVATDVKGCRDGVVPGVSGVLVPPRDAGALAEAMIALLRDDSRRAELAMGARRVAESRFDQAPVVDGTMRVYRRLLELHGGEPSL